MLTLAILLSSFDAATAVPLVQDAASSPAVEATTDASQDDAPDDDAPRDEGTGSENGSAEDAAPVELSPLDHGSRVPLAPVSIGLGAPLRSTTSHRRDARFELDLRLIEGIDSDRSRASVVATYAWDERLTLGFEAAPEDDSFSPLVVYRVFDETRERPALTVGTTTDRIGTPSGRSYWATVGRSFAEAVDFPVSVYAGAAWGEFEDELHAVGGVRIDWDRGISTTSAWNGQGLDHSLDLEFDSGWRVSLLAVDDDIDDETRFGVSVGRSF